MKILLDTHVFLWAAMDSPRLSPVWRDAVTNPDHVVFVSLVSLWEIALKQSLGKLEVPGWFYDDIRGFGYETLPLSLSHILAARDLPMHHRDPFDRMLVAQARNENLTLLTADPALKKYDADFLPA